MMLVPTVQLHRSALLWPVQSMGLCHFSHCLSVVLVPFLLVLGALKILSRRNMEMHDSQNSVCVRRGGFLRHVPAVLLVPHTGPAQGSAPLRLSSVSHMAGLLLRLFWCSFTYVKIVFW